MSHGSGHVREPTAYAFRPRPAIRRGFGAGESVFALYITPHLKLNAWQSPLALLVALADQLFLPRCHGAAIVLAAVMILMVDRMLENDLRHPEVTGKLNAIGIDRSVAQKLRIPAHRL